MGPEPLCLSGERAEGARRADRSEHTGGLPRFGPRWTRKTLLLLSLYWVGELGSLKNQLHRAYERSRFRTEPANRTEPPSSKFRTPSTLGTASFYSARGHRQVST